MHLYIYVCVCVYMYMFICIGLTPPLTLIPVLKPSRLRCYSG